MSDQAPSERVHHHHQAAAAAWRDLAALAARQADQAAGRLDLKRAGAGLYGPTTPAPPATTPGHLSPGGGPAAGGPGPGSGHVQPAGAQETGG